MNTNDLRDTWLMFQRERECSVDRMLCDPALRNDFLAAAAVATSCDEELTILWSVLRLRKNKILPAKLK